MTENGENGISRFFNSLFGNDSDDAKRHSNVSSRGCSIVTVHAQSSDQAERAADLLDDCGAVDVDDKSTEYSSASASRSSESTSRDDDSNRGGTTIPRIQENLEVGKRSEERGSVRVRSRIVEKPVEEHVRLREEHIHVERQPVNRAVTDADRNAMQDRNIELTERSEVPVVNKESRVVEEVRVSKDVTERNETVRDTVRNTEIDIDRDNNREKGNESTGNKY